MRVTTSIAKDDFYAAVAAPIRDYFRLIEDGYARSRAHRNVAWAVANALVTDPKFPICPHDPVVTAVHEYLAEAFDFDVESMFSRGKFVAEGDIEDFISSFADNIYARRRAIADIISSDPGIKLGLGH